MQDRMKNYSSFNGQEHTEKCPSCDEETFVGGRCLHCGAWYSGPLKIRSQTKSTSEQISHIITLQYSDTNYKSQVEILKEIVNENGKSFQVKIAHPGSIVQNKADFYTVWLDGEEQRYFKKKYVKPKYYFINTTQDSYIIHNWKTQRSNIVKEVKNLNTNQLIEKLLTHKN